MIASAPVEPDEFAAIIQEVNDRFGLSIEPREEAFKLFQDRIRVVAGRFWDETRAVQRKEVLQRLEKLADHVSAVTAQLSPLNEGLHMAEDTEVVGLLIRAVDLSYSDQHPRPREQLEIIQTVLERLERYCTQALLLMTHLPAKKGQRGLRWYDEYTLLMTQVADLLGVKVSTAGDRGEAAYATPFTVLAFTAEGVLPEEAQSNTLAACAKRIERSLGKKASPRRNTSKG